MKKDIFYSKEEANNFYQGWSNWHTWIINLWLNNDETLYSAFKHKRLNQLSNPLQGSPQVVIDT